jgi:hypothetical protein
MVLSLHVYVGTAASAVQASEAQQSFRRQPTFNPTRALRDKINPSATDLGNLTDSLIARSQRIPYVKAWRVLQVDWRAMQVRSGVWDI